MKKEFLLRAALLFFFATLFAFSDVSAQWTKTAGPPGMNVNVFYQKGNKLFAGTSSKGVFRSSDHGLTWIPANAGIENSSVFSMVSDGSVLIAGTDNGVYKSSNNGNSWTPANNGIEGQFVQSFLFANGYLFAGTVSFGVFKSNDQGATWTDANGGALGSSLIYAMAYVAPNIVVVADNLIFYSNDNGNSWFYPTSSPFLFSSNPTFQVQGDSIMLAAFDGVYRSFDAGQTWGPKKTVKVGIDIIGLVKTTTATYAGTVTGLYSSKDFGNTWKAIVPNGLRDGNRFNHDFYKSGKNFLLGMDELGVAYSTDKGKNWNYTQSGFTPASNIDNAVVVSGSTILSGTHSDGVYQSTNTGNTWTKIGTPDNMDSLSNAIIFSLLKINNTILAGTCGFGLYRSANNGATWTHITSGLPSQGGTGYLCVSGLAQASANVIVATDLGLYYSTDDGLTWHASNVIGSSNMGMGVASNAGTSCAVVEAPTGPSKIYRSTNGGVTWTSVFSVSGADFLCIASDGDDHFYAGTFTTNYLSNNNGTTWSPFGPGIPSGTGAFTIAAKDSLVFAGNSTGVYFSSNSGGSFVNANTGLDPSPNNAVQGLAIASDFVYAGLFQNAIWKRPLSDFGIEGKTAELSQTALKAMISPNPVTHQSTLGFEVPERANVRIEIFDQTGRSIRVVVNEVRDGGVYQEKISNWDLPAGNYLAHLQIGESRSTLQFIVAE